MDWSAEAIERLRALWAEGHSTAEIGRRMGVSKNAVVGKAHRLNLPARPSPIRREAVAETRLAPSRAGPHPPRQHLSPSPPQSPPPPDAGGPWGPPAGRPCACLPRGLRPSCAPIGEPGTADFRFCTAEATSGKPYCTQHAAVAYVKARDRREDAA